MQQIITMDAAAPANILAYAGQLFTDTSLLIWLAIGLPVGFYIIFKLVGMFQADWKKDDELIAKVEAQIKKNRS